MSLNSILLKKIFITSSDIKRAVMGSMSQISHGLIVLEVVYVKREFHCSERFQTDCHRCH